MSLGAKKLNAVLNAGLNAAKLSTTAKGVLSKAVLSKQAAAKPVAAKPIAEKSVATKAVPAKTVAKLLPVKSSAKPVAKAVGAKAGSHQVSAQKLAVTSRAALVNKTSTPSKLNGKPAIKTNPTVNKPMNAMTQLQPKPKPAPAPIDPRFEPFRDLLEAKRAELRGSLGDTRYGAQAQNGRVAEEDQAAVSHEEFISSKRNSMEFRMLRLVNAALDRIQRGEYGICHACEEDISEKRLRAIPWAEFCVLCQDSHGNVDNDTTEAATPAGAAPALQVWNW